MRCFAACQGADRGGQSRLCTSVGMCSGAACPPAGKKAQAASDKGCQGQRPGCVCNGRCTHRHSVRRGCFMAGDLPLVPHVCHRPSFGPVAYLTGWREQVAPARRSSPRALLPRNQEQRVAHHWVGGGRLLQLFPSDVHPGVHGVRTIHDVRHVAV